MTAHLLQSAVIGAAPLLPANLFTLRFGAPGSPRRDHLRGVIEAPYALGGIVYAHPYRTDDFLLSIAPQVFDVPVQLDNGTQLTGFHRAGQLEKLHQLSRAPVVPEQLWNLVAERLLVVRRVRDQVFYDADGTRVEHVDLPIRPALVVKHDEAAGEFVVGRNVDDQLPQMVYGEALDPGLAALAWPQAIADVRGVARFPVICGPGSGSARFRFTIVDATHVPGEATLELAPTSGDGSWTARFVNGLLSGTIVGAPGESGSHQVFVDATPISITFSSTASGSVRWPDGVVEFFTGAVTLTRSVTLAPGNSLMVVTVGGAVSNITVVHVIWYTNLWSIYYDPSISFAIQFYRTDPGLALPVAYNTVDGTALANVDYHPFSGVGTMAPGPSTFSIYDVSVLDNPPYYDDYYVNFGITPMNRSFSIGGGDSNVLSTSVVLDGNPRAAVINAPDFLWWKLDETSGYVAHDSGPNGYNIEILRNAVWSNGLVCNGTDCGGAVLVPSECRQAPLCISAWLTPANRGDRTSNNYSLLPFPPNAVSNNITSSGGFSIGANVWTDGGGGAAFQFENWDNNITPGPVKGVRYHVVAIYGVDASYFYVNGVLRVTRGPSSIYVAESRLFLGRHNNDTGYGTKRFFKGTIRDVRIFKSPLSPAQVATLYAQGPV